MNKSEFETSQEVGVSAWIQVPTMDTSPGGGTNKFSVRFRIGIRSGAGGGDVTPSRPTGKAVPAQTGATDYFAPDALCDCADPTPSNLPDPNSPPCATLFERGQILTLTILPVNRSAGEVQFQVERGPLSLAQGWIEGTEDGIEQNGQAEPPGYGKTWSNEGAAIILVSLISKEAFGRPDGISAPEIEVVPLFKEQKNG